MSAFGISKDTAMLREARIGSKGHKWIIELLIFVLVFLIASSIEGMPLSVAIIAWLFTGTDIISEAVAALQAGDYSAYISVISDVTAHMPAWLDILSLFCAFLIALTCILFCRWIEKRKMPSMGFRKAHAVREYLVGIVFAFVMISTAVLIGILSGAYSFRATKFSVGVFLIYMLGYMIQGMSEEVMCRGYLMVSITRKNPVWLAAVLSSAVFAALHLANPGIGILPLINLFLSGLVFAAYVLKRGNIWGACAMHSFWNFFQGNLYGISVSGTGWGMNSSIMTASVKGGIPLWSGGNFGIEGGLCDTIVELAALAVILFLIPAAEQKNKLESSESENLLQD